MYLSSSRTCEIIRNSAVFAACFLRLLRAATTPLPLYQYLARPLCLRVVNASLVVFIVFVILVTFVGAGLVLFVIVAFLFLIAI